MCVVHMIIWCIFTINSYVRSFGWTHCVIIEIYKDTCWRVLGPSTRFLWWTLKRFLCCVQWLKWRAAFRTRFWTHVWRYLWCCAGDMTDADDDGDPNWLWCVCHRPAGEDKFMIYCDCCHEWYHGECIGISVLWGDITSRDNEEYVCPLCLQLPVISLFSGLFQTFSRPLFSGAHALVLSFVMLYLLNCTLEAKLIPGPFWLLRKGFCYGTCSSLSSIRWPLEPGIYCTKGMLCSCCLDSPEA